MCVCISMSFCGNEYKHPRLHFVMDSFLHLIPNLHLHIYFIYTFLYPLYLNNFAFTPISLCFSCFPYPFQSESLSLLLSATSFPFLSSSPPQFLQANPEFVTPSLVFRIIITSFLQRQQHTGDRTHDKKTHFTLKKRGGEGGERG